MKQNMASAIKKDRSTNKSEDRTQRQKKTKSIKSHKT